MRWYRENRLWNGVGLSSGGYGLPLAIIQTKALRASLHDNTISRLEQQLSCLMFSSIFSKL
jgi:hypothetical protein